MKGKPTVWSEEAIYVFKQVFPHNWNKDLAKYFNVGWRTIVRKARELKLEKAPDFRDNIDFTQFSKGVSPTNKGMKQEEYMSPEGLEKTKLTRFKKGRIPTTSNNSEKAWNTRRENKIKNLEKQESKKIKKPIHNL